MWGVRGFAAFIKQTLNKYTFVYFLDCKLNDIKMEGESLSVNDVLKNNGELEWQPLALTLVEYPKGKIY